jgi:tRNA-(ms[2]io[6]A)-hydroxylase
MPRRLPVLQNAPPEEERPAWQWAVIGVLFIFSIWAPLAMLASWGAAQVSHRILGELPPDELSLRLADASASDRFWLWFVLTVAPIVAYALACWASGAMVGRFGGKAGPREAAVAGLVAALVGAALTLVRASPAASAASLLVLVPVGVGAAWLGGAFGKKRRTVV